MTTPSPQLPKSPLRNTTQISILWRCCNDAAIIITKGNASEKENDKFANFEFPNVQHVFSTNVIACRKRIRI